MKRIPLQPISISIVMRLFSFIVACAYFSVVQFATASPPEEPDELLELITKELHKQKSLKDEVKENILTKIIQPLSHSTHITNFHSDVSSNDTPNYTGTDAITFQNLIEVFIKRTLDSEKDTDYYQKTIRHLTMVFHGLQPTMPFTYDHNAASDTHNEQELLPEVSQALSVQGLIPYTKPKLGDNQQVFIAMIYPEAALFKNKTENFAHISANEEEILNGWTERYGTLWNCPLKHEYHSSSLKAVTEKINSCNGASYIITIGQGMRIFFSIQEQEQYIYEEKPTTLTSSFLNLLFPEEKKITAKLPSKWNIWFGVIPKSVYYPGEEKTEADNRFITVHNFLRNLNLDIARKSRILTNFKLNALPPVCNIL